MNIQREQQILQQLQLQAHVKAGDLAKILGVSLDTVRRDLKEMESRGRIRCVRGGACLPESMMAMSHFSGREVIHIEKKRLAAIKALRHIPSGGLIALNSGTTNTILAQEIVKRYSDLTVVTNNLAAASILMQSASIHTIVIGGDLDIRERSTYGHQCEMEFSSYLPDCVFLSINAVDKEAGYTDFRLLEIGIMRALASRAKKTVAVMDSSKLGRRSKKQVFDLDAVEVLVMDEVPAAEKEEYQKRGVVME